MTPIQLSVGKVLHHLEHQSQFNARGHLLCKETGIMNRGQFLDVLLSTSQEIIENAHS